MDTLANLDKPLRFGTFELDVRSRELHNGCSCKVRLQEQPFEILRMLLERPGVVVTREELQQRLWPGGTFVDFEHSLNAAVKRLRAALGDVAENPKFVETLPRRGYRFIGPIDEPTKETAAAAAPAPRLRLAVLPFANLSERSEQDYFADGLTEEMIAQLGQSCRGRLGIIARSSSMLFKQSTQRAREIGDALGAGYLLEGSVRRDGDRVRITARLIETSVETDLWVETYERHLSDYLSVQNDVAARIARSLTMELLPDAPAVSHAVSSDSSAYEAYLKGRYYWNMLADEGAEEAVAWYNRATELDPAFASAHASMARVRVLLAEYYRRRPRPILEEARQSVKKALDIEPDLFEAHVALGDVRRALEWDWRGAEAAYTHSIVLNPSFEGAHRAYGLLLAGLGREAEAIRESERACDIDPLCVVVNSGGAAWVRYLAGEYEAAIAKSRRAVEMEPRYFVAHRVLAAAYLKAGREDEAVTALERALPASGNDLTVMAWLAHAKAVTGNRDEATSLVRALVRMKETRHVPSYHLALAHAGLGDVDAAFDALQDATVECDPALTYLAVEPRFEPIRGDARYSRLIDLLGLK